MAAYEQARPPFDLRWRQVFAPDPGERLALYGAASRASYARLLGSLAALGGDGDGLAAAGARVRLMQAHLAEVGQLRDFYGVAR